MEKKGVLVEKAQIDSYKVIRRQYYIETVNNLNQLIHFIDLSYTKVDILYHGWVGYSTNNQMKEILTGHFRDIFDDYRCKNMLTDYSKMKGCFIDVNNWYTESLMLELVSLGFKNNAIILPTEPLARISVKDLNDKIKNLKRINNLSFNLLPDALNWLALI